MHSAERGSRTLVPLGEAQAGSSRFVARPFCELGPASTDQVLGVIGRHFDGAVRADVDVPAREGLHGPDTGRGLPANPISFRVLGVLTALGSPAVEFEDALARVRLLEPVQELSGLRWEVYRRSRRR